MAITPVPDTLPDWADPALASEDDPLYQALLRKAVGALGLGGPDDIMDAAMPGTAVVGPIKGLPESFAKLLPVGLERAKEILPDVQSLLVKGRVGKAGHGGRWRLLKPLEEAEQKAPRAQRRDGNTDATWLLKELWKPIPEQPMPLPELWRGSFKPPDRTQIKLPPGITVKGTAPQIKRSPLMNRLTREQQPFWSNIFQQKMTAKRGPAPPTVRSMSDLMDLLGK